MKKEQAIKNAYGEYWEAVKDYVDENGWIGFDEWFKFVGHKIDYDCKPNQIYYCHRPKSLKGIEDNNGWNLIDELLPEPSTEYHVIKNGKISKCFYIKDNRWFVDGNNFPKTSELHGITHWKPIQKPLNPIY